MKATIFSIGKRVLFFSNSLLQKVEICKKCIQNHIKFAPAHTFILTHARDM
jgi:hypothetical protein